MLSPNRGFRRARALMAQHLHSRITMRTIFRTRFALRIAATCLALLALSCQKAPLVPAESIPHPDDLEKSIEYFVSAPEGTGPWPTVVLLHGHQPMGGPGGRAFV